MLGLPDDVNGGHALAEIVARVTSAPTASTLRRLLDTAIHELKTLPSARLTVRPPIPVPDGEGITFLDTVGAIIDEGQRLRHCVATRADAAVDGRAFFFHVEVDGAAATVQVDAAGNVVEARGPNNDDNDAARSGAAQLAQWGQLFPGDRRTTTPTPTWQERVIENLKSRAEELERRRDGLDAVDAASAVESAIDAGRVMAGGAVSFFEDVLGTLRKR